MPLQPDPPQESQPAHIMHNPPQTRKSLPRNFGNTQVLQKGGEDSDVDMDMDDGDDRLVSNPLTIQVRGICRVFFSLFFFLSANGFIQHKQNKTMM